MRARMTFVVAAVLALVAAEAGAANAGRVVLEPEVRPGVSTSWTRVAEATASDTLTVVIALAHGAGVDAELERTLLAVSDPDSPAYGDHLGRAGVEALLAPDAAPAAAVTKWLRDGGATSVRVGGHGDLVRAVLPARSAEALLDVQLAWFQHNHVTGSRVLRATNLYSVPAELARYIAVIDGVLRMPNLERFRVAAPEAAPAPEAASCISNDCGSTCCTKTTPGVLHKRYNVPATTAEDYAAVAASGSSMGVAEFQGQEWDHKDLGLFSAACGFKPNITVNHQVGSNSSGGICSIIIIGQAACQESMLDIEFIKGVAPAVPLTDVYSGTYSLLDWAFTVGNMSDTEVPLVHSVSYGNDEVQQTSTAYMEAVQTQFSALGSRGISILFASGDQGPCGRSGCGSVYHPDFPGAAPSVTAVGGTDFVTAGVIGAEKAWSDGGGGFSNTFAMPAWQAQAVAAYVKTAGSSLPPASKWNATGRAYPDVAALAGAGNPYCSAVGSLMGLAVYGTSAASPVVAGVFARINAVRMAAGGKPMGFLNPWIYKNAAAFNDVLQGTITGGGPDGFPAVKGWDAATGMGTPNYEAMVKAATN